MGAAATDRRIDKLIYLLVKNATVIVPGPKIASHIGVSVQMVWEYMERLRSIGVDIRGHPGSGYQLRKLPDILTPSLIQSELGGDEIGHKFVHYFRIESTNSTALELAAEGAAHGTVVVAEEQTAGRGRFGRNWYSEKSSGIYVSIVLRPALSPTAAPVLTLMAGVAAHRALSAATGLAFDIRWPNDLLVKGKKVCGILTEMSAEVDRLHHVVIGIGINVNHCAMPAGLESIGTSLRLEGGQAYSRAPILVSVLKELGKQYTTLIKDGSDNIIREWAAASSYAQGKRIRVLNKTGEFHAVTAGIDPSGALRIRGKNGEEGTLISGEIIEVK